MLKPDEIRNEQFELSVLGGYKREQVDNFFDSVISDYEKLYNENAELLQKLKLCVEKIEEYQKDEQFLKAAIINAEKLNENSLKNIEIKEKEIEAAAREKADNIIEKAQLEAENIVKSARLEAADSIKKCEIETAAKISELKSAQDAEEKHLNSLKKEVSNFKEMILKLYENHLNSLSKLPSCEHQEKKEETVAVQEEVQVEEPVQEEVVEQIEIPEEIDIDSQTISANQKTAEFVINKNSDSKKEDDDFDKSFKFRGLKFGTDFDIKKEK